MQKTLQEALKSSVTFNIKNVTPNGQADADKKLALLPGIYDTSKFVQDGTSKLVVMSLNNPANLVNAGYNVDEVADDWGNDATGYIQVVGQKRAKFRDLLNAVQRVGMTVSRIVIQNKVSSQAIYDQEIEIARTVLGAKGSTDFIQLQDYVKTDQYDRTKIEIDLSGNPLVLTPEVFLAIGVPSGAEFSIQFVFD